MEGGNSNKYTIARCASDVTFQCVLTAAHHRVGSSVGSIRFIVQTTLNAINSACFDRQGNFFFGINNGASYYKISRPDLISSEYADIDDANLAATTSLYALHVSRPAGLNNFRAGDLASIHADFLNAGSKQDWIVALANAPISGYSAFMFRTDIGANPQYYTITVTGYVSPGSAYGACWTYRDSAGDSHIYFAANNGNGIYEVLTSTVSLSGSTGTFTVQHLGIGSASTGSNDGVTCKVTTRLNCNLGLNLCACGIQTANGFPEIPFPT